MEIRYLRNDPLGNTDNTYEVTAGKSGFKKIDDKGDDDVDHIISHNPETKTPFGTTPASTTNYDVPVETKTFGSGVAPYTAYRAPGEKVIGSITDGPIESVCYECLFIPLPKGLQLFGRGTGMAGATAKTGRILGGASRSVNYYTQAAVEAGYSTELTGARVMAGPFVQASHNVRNLFTGRGLNLLYSNSEATIIGRAWQNQAIGLGTLNIGLSVGAAVNNLSGNQNAVGIGLSEGYSVPAIDNLSHR